MKTSSRYLVELNGTAVLMLNAAQLRGLVALAGEGAEGLFADSNAAKAYIGDSRAVRAAREGLAILRSATAVSREAAPRRFAAKDNAPTPAKHSRVTP